MGQPQPVSTGPTAARQARALARRVGRDVGIAGLMALLAATPSSAANREHQQLMADIRMLQEQNQQLQLMLSTLQETLKVVNAKLEEQATNNRKLAADQKLQVDGIGSDVRVVRERLDDTNVRLSSLAQEIDALRQSIPKSAPMTTTLDPNAPQTPEGTQPAPAPAPVAASTAGLSPQRLFDEAKGDYAVGQFALALAGFEQLIKTFPKSDLAPEAQYYIGETHLIEGKNDKAAAAYGALIASYPASPQLSSAYYKRGVALFRLGEVDNAVESWDYCVKSFPNSDASRLAKQSLESARRQRKP
ncbi:MAG: tetratricopeptide repeat protein [Vicinamibacterales bacterium]